MSYDPDRHHRRSIRLRDYDYSQAGAYFVTICIYNREYLLGEIDGVMVCGWRGVDKLSLKPGTKCRYGSR